MEHRKCCEWALTMFLVEIKRSFVWMEKIGELDRYRAAYTLLSKLKDAEEEAERVGYISADDVEKELGINKSYTYNWRYSYMLDLKNNVVEEKIWNYVKRKSVQ